MCVTSFNKKLGGIVVVVVVAGVLIGFYISSYLMSGPPAFKPTTTATRNVNLTIQTVAAVGSTLSPHADWVSSLVRNPQGEWVRTTNWTVPAHSVVHVTVYQFDGDSGLRNPFMGKVRGTIGNTMQVDGKTLNVLDGELASHTFAIPSSACSFRSWAWRTTPEPVRLRPVRDEQRTQDDHVQFPGAR